MKSPLSWYGGKYYIADKIISYFPEHQTFIEVFGGAGHIIFKKTPSELDVYNDIDSDLYNFFKVLRESPEEFIKSLQLTPYSREEFYHCRDNYNSASGIERARMFYVSVYQSFSGNRSSWSFSVNVSRRGMSQATSQFLTKIDKVMPEIIERLREIQIENNDFQKILELYDHKEALFYLDPPYVHDSRDSSVGYKYEMDDINHERMINCLLGIKGKAILSGYENDIYKRLENNGWRKILIGEFSKNSAKIKSSNRDIGKEFIWINYSSDEKKEYKNIRLI